MSVVIIRPAAIADWPRMAEVWEAAVRASHGFLTEEDIVFFRGFLPEVFGRLNVSVAEFDGAVAGFIATAERHVEALFVAPELHGKGLGRRLLDHAIAREPSTAWTVDVNEQNPGATRFYEHYGFVRIGRSELDASGRPFPLLHLALRR